MTWPWASCSPWSGNQRSGSLWGNWQTPRDGSWCGKAWGPCLPCFSSWLLPGAWLPAGPPHRPRGYLPGRGQSSTITSTHIHCVCVSLYMDLTNHCACVHLCLCVSVCSMYVDVCALSVWICMYEQNMHNLHTVLKYRSRNNSHWPISTIYRIKPSATGVDMNQNQTVERASTFCPPPPPPPIKKRTKVRNYQSVQRSHCR